MTRNYTEFGSFENLRMPLDKITHKILYNSNKNVCFVHSSRIGLGAGGNDYRHRELRATIHFIILTDEFL